MRLDISEFVDSAIGLPVSYAWKGHGSTIFFELGKLARGKKRRDGSTGNPIGQYTLFIEPNWRIEGPRSILCGSDDSHSQILRALEATISAKTEHIYISGHLPELQVVFSNGWRLRTFSAWKGQPSWTIHRWSLQLALYSNFGHIKLDGGAPNNSFKPKPLRGSA